MNNVNKMISILIVIILILGVAYLINRLPKPAENNMTNEIRTETGNELKITPISHASMVLDFGGNIVYTDPTGGANAFSGQASPALILLTDIHGDHLDLPTLQAVAKEGTVVIAPPAVADQISSQLAGASIVVLKNGETAEEKGFKIEAIPMYNLPEKADAFHIKGRGNGYVVEKAGKRVYISGDTSGIPEMRNLKNIDHAFVSMNLPYTMSVEEAAEAVLAMKPKTVTPYHYRGQDGLSDINKFRELVNAGDPSITVDLMDFYPATGMD
jgi:L-ascorbate metabolism protein UlaG (beta-lactamase superfamily)